MGGPSLVRRTKGESDYQRQFREAYPSGRMSSSYRRIRAAATASFMLDHEAVLKSERRHEEWWSVPPAPTSTVPKTNAAIPLVAPRMVKPTKVRQRLLPAKAPRPNDTGRGFRLFMWCYLQIGMAAFRRRKAKARRSLRRNPNCKTFIVERIRKRMAKAIKDGKGMKSGTSREIIGCDWDTLRAHLSAGLVNGMTWDNYGQYGWHIDHIVPLSCFNMKDPDQVKAAWNYKNLQPLWWTDNLDKLARLDWTAKSPAGAIPVAFTAQCADRRVNPTS